MKDFNESPDGATYPDGGETGIARPSGWRKVTANTVHSGRLADVGQTRAASKTRAVVAVKRVGAHLGLKAADLLLLDTLSAFTQRQDWEEGRRPIVWASNAYLMEQTGFSLSTLKRHARRLAEQGIIAFQDSPNGKRWGRRDRDGVIIEAYGFDLGPMIARLNELEALAAALAAERAQCQRLKRMITIARRSIRARLEAAPSATVCGGLWAAFEALLARLPRVWKGAEALQALSEKFTELLGRVEALFAARADSEVIENETLNMTPSGVRSEPHIQITNQLHSVTCNSSEKEESSSPAHSEREERHKKSPIGIELNTVLQACPEFREWGRTLGGYVGNWRQFARLADDLRPMIGVSDHAWDIAQQQLGRSAAAAALALVFEKVQSGEISSAGGYLRGMVEKAGAGELHLERSFYGRLSSLAS